MLIYTSISYCVDLFSFEDRKRRKRLKKIKKEQNELYLQGINMTSEMKIRRTPV